MTDERLLIAASLPTVEPGIEDTERTGHGGGFIVTVFNNDYNTWDEVMAILQIATKCTPEEAYIETWEIDNLGSSVVHHGGEEECNRVAEVIGTIGIKVQVSDG